MSKNYVPCWYVGCATVSLPEGLIRYIVKPGFSIKGESEASERQEKFLSGLTTTVKLLGGYTEDQVKESIKEIKFFSFTNINGKNVEDRVLELLKKISSKKPAKDISLFGMSGKDSSSIEMYQVAKVFYDQFIEILTELKNEDQLKYNVLRNNEKVIYNALLLASSNPAALEELLKKLSDEIDPKRSNDESIAKNFLSSIEEILSDQDDLGDLPESDDLGDTKNGFSLLNHFSHDEKPLVSMKNEGRFYIAYDVNGKPYEHSISVRKGGACRIQASRLGNLNFTQIKKLHEASRLAFKDTDTESSFKEFVLNPVPYATKFAPK